MLHYAIYEWDLDAERYQCVAYVGTAAEAMSELIFRRDCCGTKVKIKREGVPC